MIQIKSFLATAIKVLMLGTIVSAASASASWAEEETGPAFAPPAAKTTAPEIGPGIKKTSPDSGSGFVVVLDPGHGKVNGGYSGCSFEWNGIRYYEDEITMKIAGYTKSYLEQFPNYTVYLTKDSVEKSVPLDERATFAASVQADLFVSQHVDSSGTAGSVTNAAGASGLAPRTGRYNNDLATQSQEAANSILNQLSALGINNRGLLLRDSQTGTLYPDGSLADYYAIPRYSQLLGIRGFIIEHGFLNNASDASLFLTTEEQYKALGEADAKGIMEYLQKIGNAGSGNTATDSGSAAAGSGNTAADSGNAAAGPGNGTADPGSAAAGTDANAVGSQTDSSHMAAVIPADAPSPENLPASNGSSPAAEAVAPGASV